MKRFTTRRPLALVLIAAVAASLCVGYVVASRTRFTEAAKGVRAGMTGNEVEAILGKPGLVLGRSEIFGGYAPPEAHVWHRYYYSRLGSSFVIDFDDQRRVVEA